MSIKSPNESLYELGLNTLKSLEVPNGVLASARHEIYGCIFGRDSLIVALRLLSAYTIHQDPYYLHVAQKIIRGLAALQGKEINIESGEEPGKCIHEFRQQNHEHLTKGAAKWYLYEDGAMRNFDSLDATPLFLIAAYRYWQKSQDSAFIESIMPNIERALVWVNECGDKNGDEFLDYQLHQDRKHGGLMVQSWMDSSESLFHEEPGEIMFPIAPVEAQAYAYLALTLWSDYFNGKKDFMAKDLLAKARHIKKQFNKKFVIQENGRLAIASAIDGAGKPLASVRSSMGHILWASINHQDDGRTDSILDERHIPLLIKRLLEPDIFEPSAGIRTLSKKSKAFEAMSYHNGSIWPHDTSLIAEGMDKLGYHEEAQKIRHAIFSAYTHFNSPIELFSFSEDKFQQYQSPTGHAACQQQAWSAASMIVDALSLKNHPY